MGPVVSNGENIESIIVGENLVATGSLNGHINVIEIGKN